MAIYDEVFSVPEKFDLDLGHDHYLQFTGWKPDRDLNPQYEGISDIERAGAIVYHKSPDGKLCCGAIHFDSNVARKVFQARSMWQVESWEPLTLSPSLLCKACGDHGFIKQGKWQVA